MKNFCKILLCTVLLVIILIAASEVAYYLLHNQFFAGSISTYVNSGELKEKEMRPLSPSMDEIQLITLGGSTTFGPSVSYNQTWPYLVAESLGAKLMNLAMLGGNLTETKLWLRGEYRQRLHRNHLLLGQELGPPEIKRNWPQECKSCLFILAPQINDVAPDLLHSFHKKHFTIHHTVSKLCIKPFIQKLALCSFIVPLSLKTQNTELLLPVVFDSQELTEITKAYSKRLNDLVKELAPHGKVTLLHLPNAISAQDTEANIFKMHERWGANDSHSHFKVMLQILEYAENIDKNVISNIAINNDLTFIQTEDIAMRSIQERLHLYIDPIHAGPQLQEIISQEVIKKLKGHWPHIEQK